MHCPKAVYDGCRSQSGLFNLWDLTNSVLPFTLNKSLPAGLCSAISCLQVPAPRSLCGDRFLQVPAPRSLSGDRYLMIPRLLKGHTQKTSSPTI